jgi:hypothetical protein
MLKVLWDDFGDDSKEKRVNRRALLPAKKKFSKVVGSKISPNY